MSDPSEAAKQQQEQRQKEADQRWSEALGQNQLSLTLGLVRPLDAPVVLPKLDYEAQVQRLADGLERARQENRGQEIIIDSLRDELALMDAHSQDQYSKNVQLLERIQQLEAKQGK